MRSHTRLIWELPLAFVTELTRHISGFSVAADRIRFATRDCFFISYFEIFR
jgi:hypothetical protein